MYSQHFEVKYRQAYKAVEFLDNYSIGGVRHWSIGV